MPVAQVRRRLAIVCAIIEVVSTKKPSRSRDQPARPGGPVGDRVTYVGHATVLLELDGKRLLTDPVLRRRVGPLRRQANDPPAGITRGIDAVLLSHLHLDHSDRPLAAAPRPAGARARCRRAAGSSCVGAGFASRDRAGPGRVRERRRSARRGHACRARGQRAALSRRRSTGDRLSGRGRPAHLLRRRHRPVRRDGEPRPGRSTWRCCRSGAGARRSAPGHLGPRARRAGGRRCCEPRIAVPIHWGTFFPLGLARWQARVPASIRRRRFARLVARGRAPGRGAGPQPRRVDLAVAVGVLRAGRTSSLGGRALWGGVTGLACVALRAAPREVLGDPHRRGRQWSRED